MVNDKYCLLKVGGLSGSSGAHSKLVYATGEDAGKFAEGDDNEPKVGYCVWVGDYGTENWWRTSPITNIIEDSVAEGVRKITFETLNSVYWWSMVLS